LALPDASRVEQVANVIEPPMKAEIASATAM